MIMTRTFHPVGQGAYSTEQFQIGNAGAVNVVYDCGSESLDYGCLSEVIKRSFNKGTDVDAVFISHFDCDHVNGLPFLLTWCNVKQIFLPVVSSEAEIAYLRFKSLVNVGEKSGFTIAVADCLLNLDNAERGECFVGWPELRGNPVVNWVKPSLQDAQFDSSPIGDGLGLKGWSFVPYNYQQFEHETIFREAFANALSDLSLRIGIDEFVSNTKNVFEQLSEKDAKRLLAAINKRLRSRLKNGINANSMVVYSGESEDAGLHRMMLECYCFDAKKKDYASGCMFFGDYEASNNYAWHDLKQFYSSRKYWNGIGCVQLPHHGSQLNYNADFEVMDACFVAAFGLGNKHHHPGKEGMISLMKSNHSVRLVTETNYYRLIRQTIK